jgi:hypothetical protein
LIIFKFRYLTFFVGNINILGSEFRSLIDIMIIGFPSALNMIAATIHSNYIDFWIVSATKEF